jgi:hypothetical protein
LNKSYYLEANDDEAGLTEQLRSGGITRADTHGEKKLGIKPAAAKLCLRRVALNKKKSLITMQRCWTPQPDGRKREQQQQQLAKPHGSVIELAVVVIVRAGRGRPSVDID